MSLGLPGEWWLVSVSLSGCWNVSGWFLSVLQVSRWLAACFSWSHWSLDCRQFVSLGLSVSVKLTVGGLHLLVSMVSERWVVCLFGHPDEEMVGGLTPSVSLVSTELVV